MFLVFMLLCFKYFFWFLIFKIIKKLSIYGFLLIEVGYLWWFGIYEKNFEDISRYCVR